MAQQPHRQQPYPTDSTYPQQPVGGPGPLPPNNRSDERAAAVIAHLSALIAALISAGSLSLLGPLIVWLIYRNKSAMVRQAAAGAFNFNLAWWILYWVGWVFAFTFVGIVVAVPLWIFISIAALWCHIRGAMRAGDGLDYSYPFQLKVLR